MMAIGENLLGKSEAPSFFRVENFDTIGILPPNNRKGDGLRSWVRSLSGFQKEAIVISALSGKAWRLVSDEGPYLNGHDEAPCPLAFLSVGMAASYMNEIYALAKIRNVRIGSLELVLNNYYTSKGSMQKRTMTGGAENIELDVKIESDLDEATVNDFLIDATYASPLNGLMRGKLDSLFRLSHNRREIDLTKAQKFGSQLLADPKNNFELAMPSTVQSDLVQKVGETPKKFVKKGTSSGGSSLSDQQDRRLNIGAVARMRADGIKEIQQMQYSPHGTSFKFLSSEDGRAPDANTLISAGIGFCFMTQFGRLSSMLKLDLKDYKIIQDTHFSLGGASGGTLTAGSADPIETHCYLETGESDQIAQDMVDLAEQTCFLHAFCKTDLKTKLRSQSSPLQNEN
jgi:organic hydroperoxide reductase OsmC/OhrA/uncharacterized OsmC-like protein